MGKGDRKSKRGKIWRGTFGKKRPKESGQKQKIEQAVKA
ncbi:30S ribosomal protein THX [Tellurirhabdus rosea]|nr:30S ribosomal protein THX [Tellurirhabdus rosea]